MRDIDKKAHKVTSCTIPEVISIFPCVTLGHGRSSWWDIRSQITRHPTQQVHYNFLTTIIWTSLRTVSDWRVSHACTSSVSGPDSWHSQASITPWNFRHFQPISREVALCENIFSGRTWLSGTFIHFPSCPHIRELRNKSTIIPDFFWVDPWRQWKVTGVYFLIPSCVVVAIFIRLKAFCMFILLSSPMKFYTLSIITQE